MIKAIVPGSQLKYHYLCANDSDSVVAFLLDIVVLQTTYVQGLLIDFLCAGSLHRMNGVNDLSAYFSVLGKVHGIAYITFERLLIS